MGFSIVWTTLLLGLSTPESDRWLESLFWLLAATTSLVSLARRLPEQNVLMSSLLAVGLSTAIAGIAAKTSIPFGPRSYTEILGDRILGIPWAVPLQWLVVIINGRGVARLIMRPWRKTTYYGFWVIGLTCALAVVFDAQLEPFATHARHYWFWETHADIPGWFTAPWVNFLGWFVTTLAILGFTTPWLINKQPIKQPTDYHPLVLWLLFGCYFTTGNAIERLWPAVALGVITNAIVTVYAARGARW